MGFRGPNGHHNNVLDDRTDAHCDDRYAQGLSNALLVSRTTRVLSEIRWVICKSLFGEAAAKSDLARSGFVRTVGKTSILTWVFLLGTSASAQDFRASVCLCDAS
jgi:hypothetical protein